MVGRLRERHALLHVRAEAGLLERRAHAQQHALGAELPRPQDRLAQRLAVRAVRAHVVVVEPDDHRRVVTRADEVRAERDDRARSRCSVSVISSHDGCASMSRRKDFGSGNEFRSRPRACTARYSPYRWSSSASETSRPPRAQPLDVVGVVERQHGLALVHARLDRQLREPLLVAAVDRLVDQRLRQRRLHVAALADRLGQLDVGGVQVAQHDRARARQPARARRPRPSAGPARPSSPRCGPGTGGRPRSAASPSRTSSTSGSTGPRRGAARPARTPRPRPACRPSTARP